MHGCLVFRFRRGKEIEGGEGRRSRMTLSSTSDGCAAIGDPIDRAIEVVRTRGDDPRRLAGADRDARARYRLRHRRTRDCRSVRHHQGLRNAGRAVFQAPWPRGGVSNRPLVVPPSSTDATIHRDEFPIVDPHQHFWDLRRNYHPWLCDPVSVPFRYGDYAAIERNYLPPDYRRDAARYRIVKAVHVEAEWDRADPVGETRWIDRIHREFGLPSACVGHAEPDRPDIQQTT